MSRCSRIASVALIALGIGDMPARATDSGGASVTGTPAPAPDSVLPGAGLGADEAPGFAALGKSTSDVANSASAKALSLGLLNGLDKNGNFNTGIALQFSPYLLANQASLTQDEYRAHQLLARLTVSLATAKGADSDRGLYATAGLLWVPVATDDPYGDQKLYECKRRFKDATTNDDPQTVIIPGTKKGDSGPELAKCFADFKAKRKYNVQLGVAPIFFSPTGKTGDFRTKGVYASAQAKVTLPGEGLQVLAIASYRSKEPVPDPVVKDAFVDRERLSVGGKLLWGNPKTLLFGVEAAYQHARYATIGRDDYLTYVGSVDVKVAEQLWLGLSAGGSRGQRFDGNPGYVGLTFTWSKAPNLK